MQTQAWSSVANEIMLSTIVVGCLQLPDMQASRMLHYLGDHILMLLSMHLRDFLRLKVELQGTRGEGSKAV